MASKAEIRHSIKAHRVSLKMLKAHKRQAEKEVKFKSRQIAKVQKDITKLRHKL